MFFSPTTGELKNLSYDKYSKVPFLVHEEIKNNKNRIRFGHSSKTKAALSNGHLSITRNLGVPLGIESGNGIGITKFFQGKNILITGGTGLLGKGTFLRVHTHTYAFIYRASHVRPLQKQCIFMVTLSEHVTKCL